MIKMELNDILIVQLKEEFGGSKYRGKFIKSTINDLIIDNVEIYRYKHWKSLDATAYIPHRFISYVKKVNDDDSNE